MSLIGLALSAAESTHFPDAMTRLGIESLVGRTSRRLAAAPADATSRFALDMDRFPIAVHVIDANAQHYEVPSEFFGLVLGPQRKYSCCLYPDSSVSLEQAEELALAETARRADLRDGQKILELGCGWGSFSLWMAAAFPNAQVLAVSNSHSQRAYIGEQAALRGLANIEVVTADMNEFQPGRTFDRIASIEMFEHMANWRKLLARTRSWLMPEGRVFVHVFAHRTTPYRFDHTDQSDWIAQHFFTGGLMPSHRLMHEFGDILAVEDEWRWDGRHYARTAGDWLANHDRHSEAVRRALGWIYKIARNLRIDAIRRERRDALIVVDRSDVPEESAQPLNIVVSREEESRVRAAVALLSEEQQKVIALSFFEDRPHAEISRLLSLPLGTVKSRLRLATKRLRDVLDDFD